MKINGRGHVTLAEYAQFCGVNRTTVWRKVKHKNIPLYDCLGNKWKKGAGTIFINPDDVNKKPDEKIKIERFQPQPKTMKRKFPRTRHGNIKYL